MSVFTSTVRDELRRRARKEVKAAFERYFRGQVQFLGCKKPTVKAVGDVVLPLLQGASLEEKRAEAFALLRSPWMEERQVGALLLHKIRRNLPDDVVEELAALFDAHVRDWASCDMLCGQVLRELMKRPKPRKRILAWRRSKNPWRQRASAVSLLSEARHGEVNDDVLAVCARIVQNPDRFVHLGAGWVLRELSLADRGLVLRFLDEHAASISREGLRYALEKMPATVRARAMASHAARTRSTRRQPAGPARRPSTTTTRRRT